MIRVAVILLVLLAGGTAAHPQPADAPPTPGASRVSPVSLGEVAHTSGPHRAAVRSNGHADAVRPFDWTAIAVGTSAGAARGVTVVLATLNGSAQSLLLDADEVEPLLA